ncbi:pentapeptide repeat-containing protein [Myxosarcina sp. GI1]|uniref:pentapeptide repeat-containing protein n=1 Tax=Myxosarcina sp. GI1 TaxID=1541065 RepID=UPI00056117B5|nr:pentapeptide repeat-containing protein [Myxosarcina sp. GI1]
MQEANLLGTNLQNADLRGANLFGAKIPNFEKPYYDVSDGTYPKLNGAAMLDGTIYSGEDR